MSKRPYPRPTGAFAVAAAHVSLCLFEFGCATAPGAVATATDFSRAATGETTAAAALDTQTGSTMGDGLIADSQPSADGGSDASAPAQDLPTFLPKDGVSSPDDAADADPPDAAAADTQAWDAAAPGPDGIPVSDAGSTPPTPWSGLDEISLVIVAGDSVGAGYNAAGGNAAGGQGFARLVYQNHNAWPNYASHNVLAAHPGAKFVSVAKSGAQSGEALVALKTALGDKLPKTVAGDVLLLINVGGNDFNDSQTVMVSAAKTASTVQALRENVAEMIQVVRKQYEFLPAKRVVVVVDGVHDPTDGKGTVPPTYTAGFCKALSNPALPMVKDAVLTNLTTVNAGLKAEALAQGALFVDLQAAFQGHGVNSGGACWIDKDCVHPTNPGHDLIRRRVWLALTGKEY